MTDDDGELRETAVRNVKALGLSEYAARTLVALSALGRATAREVSESSSVPRTRVYDAVDELADHGLVTVEGTDPKVFVPTSPDRIRQRFFREYLYRLTLVVLSLIAIAPRSSVDEGVEVTTGTGPAAIDERLREAIDGAVERLTYVAVERTPSPVIRTALAAATDRGVDVRVVAVGRVDLGDLGRAVPDASVLDSTEVHGRSDARIRFLLADDAVAHVGVATGDSNDGEVGLFSTRPDTTVSRLLRSIVEVAAETAE